MTLEELQKMAYQASGDGIHIDALRDAQNGAVVLRVRKRDGRNGEWISGHRKFMPLDLETKPDIERHCRETICEMTGALVAFEMSHRLGIQDQEPQTQRIVQVHS